MANVTDDEESRQLSLARLSVLALARGGSHWPWRRAFSGSDRPDAQPAVRRTRAGPLRRIFGVIRVNTGMGHGSEGAVTGVSLDDVASRNFTVVREDEIAFNVAGVITKEHVADSVAGSIKAYP